MSAVMLDLASASSATGTMPHTYIATCTSTFTSTSTGSWRLNQFPPGSRFPRRAALTVPDAPTRVSEVQVGNAPIFSVGAQFPRRSTADVIVYLAEQELRGRRVPSTRPVIPIGARFPLR